MIQIVCNGCKKPQDARQTWGSLPRALTPWVTLKKVNLKSVNEEEDIHLCKDCANKLNLR